MASQTKTTKQSRNQKLRQLATELFNRPLSVVRERTAQRKRNLWNNRPGSR